MVYFFSYVCGRRMKKTERKKKEDEQNHNVQVCFFFKFVKDRWNFWSRYNIRMLK